MGIYFTKYTINHHPLDKKLLKNLKSLLTENRWIDDNEVSLMVKK